MIAQCIWVKNSYIKFLHLVMAPEATSFNVQTCFIATEEEENCSLDNGCKLKGAQFQHSERRQAVAIPDFTVSQDGEAFLYTNHSMIDTIKVATNTHC